MPYDSSKVVSGVINVQNDSIIFTPSEPFEENVIYEVFVDGNIASTDGIKLGNEYNFKFQTVLSPMFCDIGTIIDDIGGYLDIPKDLIARRIYRSSVFVTKEAHDNYLELIDGVYTVTYEAKQFVRYDTNVSLIRDVIFNKVKNSGEEATLGDFTVRERSSSVDIRILLDSLSDFERQRLKYLDAIMGHHNRRWADPVVATKGKNVISSIKTRGWSEK